jgi:hypothetical protein
MISTPVAWRMPLIAPVRGLDLRSGDDRAAVHLPDAGPLTASEFDHIMTRVTDEAAHIAALIDDLARTGHDQILPPAAGSPAAAAVRSRAAM